MAKIVALLVTVIGLYTGGVQHLQTASPLFNFFFSPNDLYDPLACTEFDLSTVGGYELNFQNKYPGNHSIAVLVEHPPRVSDSYLTDFKLIIKIIDGSKAIIDKEITKPIFSFWGGGKQNSGFAVFTYKVPLDLERERALRATVQIEVPDEKFTARYGKQKICIQKFSDE